MPIKSKIQSLLFISAKPMNIKQMAGLIGKPVGEIKKAADELVKDYEEKGAGVKIIKNKEKYQMVSSPDNAEIVKKFIQDETTGELTRPSLETLTIIAYRGPIARLDLDRIRGVNCALILRNLLLRGLIEAKYEKKKRETYYDITFDFIRYLGISDITKLPDYERLNKDDTINKFLEEEKNI